MNLICSLMMGIVFTMSGWASAADLVPDCKSGGSVLQIDNSQVLGWKATTANQFQSRGHIQGLLVQALPDHSGHHHLSVQIGPNSNDTIEVIYNEAFGPLPNYQVGSEIEACGDYITSNKPTNSYPASPDGAIIHWVHTAPNGGHDSGFVLVDGVLCGQQSGGNSSSPPRHGRRPGH